MSNDGEENLGGESPRNDEDFNELLDSILDDPRKKEAMLKRLNSSDEAARDSAPSGKTSGSGNPTLSGKVGGDDPSQAQSQFPQPPAAPPFWWPQAHAFYPPFMFAGAGPGAHAPTPAHWGHWLEGPSCSRAEATSESEYSTDVAPPRGKNKGKKRQRSQSECPEEEAEEDAIDLLDESEALELVEFDPSVEPKDSWEPPKVIDTFLTKYFNKALSDAERDPQGLPKAGVWGTDSTQS